MYLSFGLVTIALNNGVTRLYTELYDSFKEYNLADGKVTDAGRSYFSDYIECTNHIKIGNNLYRFIIGSYYGRLQKFNFSSSEYERITDDIYYNAAAVRNNYIYLWKNDKFQKMSVSDGEMKELAISKEDENVEFEDMGSLSKISTVFFAVDDNTMIFYDNDMKAFRKLEKNK